MENKEHNQFIDKVVEALKKAATEIEEFQVQAALGKAEALDKYEEIKKKFNVFVQESKSKAQTGKEKVEDINAKFDTLRVQLALGKAETKEAFKAQKKELLLALHELEVKIKTNETFKRAYAFVLIEIEKFKLNLEVLEQKFDEKKEEATTSFESGKEDFKAFINEMKTKYSKKEETRWEHFNNEVSEAFSHLKNAFAHS